MIAKSAPPYYIIGTDDDGGHDYDNKPNNIDNEISRKPRKRFLLFKKIGSYISEIRSRRLPR